jgi:hypothetical protein
MKTQTVFVLTLVVLTFVVTVNAQEPANEQAGPGQDS